LTADYADGADKGSCPKKNRGPVTPAPMSHIPEPFQIGFIPVFIRVIRAIRGSIERHSLELGTRRSAVCLSRHGNASAG
jgi:hypothetical protein